MSANIGMPGGRGNLAGNDISINFWFILKEGRYIYFQVKRNYGHKIDYRFAQRHKETQDFKINIH
jgi:hypothetical protein